MVRMQRVQALTRLSVPLTMMWVRWMLGRKTRLVFLCEKLTLLPACRVFPQISHIATIELPFTRARLDQYHAQRLRR